LRRGLPAAAPKEYWDLRFTLDAACSVEEACEQLDEKLRESIRLRMIAEVPLGAFLSGGVDSSAVVALMAGLSNEPVNTCSIAFDDPAFNEAQFAQKVADRYRTRHHCDLVASDDFDLVDTLASLYDEPYADSSAIPTYRVCQLARRHVTVALSGDGGDETFGGYRRYRLHLMEDRLRAAVPHSVRRPLFGLLGRCYPKADWAPRMFRAKTTFEGMARTSVEAYFHSVSILRGPMRKQLFTDRFRREIDGYSAEDVFRYHAGRADTDDPLALIQYLDLKTYLVGDINTKVDRASMAHSLEVREPLMDHELLEWMATPAVRVQGPRPGRQVPAQESDGATLAPGHPLSTEDGIFGAPGALVPRPTARARPRRGARPAPGGDRLVQRGLPAARRRCPPVGRQRLQRRAVDPADVRGLPAQRRGCADRSGGGRQRSGAMSLGSRR
jgi:asparagine synthase (glutamine-hydrolysing)